MIDTDLTERLHDAAGGCRIGECERAHEARGLCATHYRRLLRTGDAEGVRKPGMVGREACTIPDCDGTHLARGLCSKHLARTRSQLPDAQQSWCNQENCGVAHYALGLCARHYALLRRNGTPAPVREVSPIPSYATVHSRLRRVRGSAALLACHDCGGSAAQWSYDHSDKSAVEEEVNGRLVVYSADICHYMPRCIPCHIEFDRRH